MQALCGDVFDNIDGLEHFDFVDIDAAHRRFLRCSPLGVFKTRARRERDVLKLSKIGRKAIENGAG